jgi:hypothetical protein
MVARAIRKSATKLRAHLDGFQSGAGFFVPGERHFLGVADEAAALSRRAPDGQFTTFDVPGASGLGTARFSINLLGAVTGEFFDSNNAMHGFSRSTGGAFTTFDAPHAGAGAFQGTRPSTNNLEGSVTGWYIDANNLYHGFVWQPY